MHLKNPLPGSPADWLRHAYSDLELARTRGLSNKILLEELCFHAQQTVEKSLKGLLIAKNISFPKTHNIRTLLDLIPQDITVPCKVNESAILTDYAVMRRYPGVLEDIDETEYLNAIHLAESVIHWVEIIIQDELK